MLKKVRRNSWIRHLIRICTKMEWALQVYHSSGFCVIWLTTRHTLSKTNSIVISLIQITGTCLKTTQYFPTIFFIIFTIIFKYQPLQTTNTEAYSSVHCTPSPCNSKINWCFFNQENTLAQTVLAE